MAPAEQDPNARYEVRHQIGRGSFGSAFLVTNKQDKADYVLKRVRLAKQTKWQRNFTLQERDLATSLRHPFIVPCVESWVVQNHTVNMIYAFCQNGDLSSYLTKIRKQEGQVEEGLMHKWLCQLLLALDYLQTQGVLHRDIKTSNLMLTCDNDVQLGDFGLATLMEEDGDEHKPQDTNLVGTPHYMSPELLSCKAYGFKTDVWSLGCVFYELTAQRPTFNAFNIHGLVSKIKKNKLAPLPSSYSADWKDAIELMLCKNPDKRPSVQQLMALPVLRPAMLAARERARELMPSVPLPPLLDPTPLTPQPLLGQYRLSGGQDVPDESEGSAGSASDQHGGRSCGGGSDAGSSKMSSRADRRSAAGLTAAQAVQASELSDLWKANFGNLQQQEQLDTTERQSAADAQSAVLQEQGQGPVDMQDSPAGLRLAGVGSDAGSRRVGSAGGCSPADSSSSATTPGQAAADGKGLPAGYSPRNGQGIIDGYRRIMTPSRQAHVNQPGIRRTPSERVAAAIAAAGGSAAQAAAAEAGGAATGRLTPDLCPRPAAVSGPSLARTSRSSTSSSKRATSGALTPEGVSPPAQLSPAGASVTPCSPSSNSNSSTKQRSSTSITPRQDSARSSRHRASDCTHVHSSGSHTARPRTGQQAGKQSSPTGGSTTSAAAATPTRPLSAPRSSPGRRLSDRGHQGPSSGGGSKQQRPPWGVGAGGRSCLTPGRQRPEQSPFLKAAKASNAAAVAEGSAAGPAAAAPPAGTGILADAAAAAAGKKQRRSKGQLSLVPREQLSARGAGAPATGVECVAERGTPVAQQQEQTQVRLSRRSNSSGSAGNKAAQAGATEQPAHGFPRSCSTNSAAAKQQQQTAFGASPQGASPPLQHRRSRPGGAALPPLPLHQVQHSSRDDMQSPAMSPIPLGSPVHGQDTPGPVGLLAAQRSSSSKQQQPATSGGPFITLSAAAQSARASDSAGQQADAKRATIAQARHFERSAAALSGMEHLEGRTEPSAIDLEQKAHTAGAAHAGPAPTSATGSTSSSRRVSGASSTSRQSSGGGQGFVSPGDLSSRHGSLQVAEQQQRPEAAKSPAAGISPMVSRHNSGSATPKREQQQHQQQQEAQQQQSVDEQSQQPDQQVLQRLELLESAMMVISGLVARKRWTELSSVMRSEGLLPDGVLSQHAAAAGSLEQQQQTVSHVLKLGDIVVLGRSRSIRGKIRYVGPVAWDQSAADWVGMELDRPCGVDATQRGLTYFDCQPLCASFHKASDLTTLGG